MLIYSKMKGSTDVFPLVIFFRLRPANSAETGTPCLLHDFVSSNSRNQKSMLCVNGIGCFHWKCVNWKSMVSDWLCDKCIMAALPFLQLS